MPDERGFPTKKEKAERYARLQRAAEEYADAAVFVSGGDAGMNAEIRREALDRFWRTHAQDM